MEWMILLALLVIAALFLLANPGGGDNELSYVINQPLYSPAERSFFGVLNRAVEGEAVVLGKVRVADVLRPTRGMNRSNWQKAFNRISSKHPG